MLCVRDQLLERSSVLVTEEARAAIEELLIVARRDGMSADEVADRLEMVAYFHRELLASEARDWVVRAFESTLADGAGG